MREPFLFYEEKAMPTTDEKAAKAARSPKPANSTRRQERPSKQGGFTKQTYSAFVSLPGSNTRKKWHLTAYFIDHTELPVIDQDQLLSRVQVPQGIYQTGKGLIRKSDRLLRDDEDYSESERCTPSYHVPSPRNLSISTSFGSMPTDEGSHSPWSASSASSLPLTPPAHPSTLPLPAYYAASSGGYSPARMPSLPMPDSSCLPPSIPLALPSIRNSPYLSPHLQSFQPLEPSEPFDAKSQSRYTYTPRSHEDQRAVGAFRIAL
ncbi:hypothetical protein BOTBODRAFT_35389 [Botryobasidium botryosum FD-172 SS1]|uniref:Uncharacterized protein n=1 Tax=Botryobasidium botryosum (strain FD-172 SS1) TaxID=930990 RepID=A0A067M6E2_BOTB1|nr:hypothetical protein BOTBODRAFT_35389 [Botryobasidium botryosum FD-172 SS1]